MFKKSEAIKVVFIEKKESFSEKDGKNEGGRAHKALPRPSAERERSELFSLPATVHTKEKGMVWYDI